MKNRSESQKRWDRHFIELAAFIAQRFSKDPSTKVGAVLVGSDRRIVSMGFNGFARNVREDIPDRHKRPIKYLFTAHAERNALDNADGPVRGTTLYMNYQPIPCCHCTLGVIQNGIKEIVGPPIPFPGKGVHWQKELSLSMEMLQEAKIQIRTASLKGTPKEVMDILYPDSALPEAVSGNVVEMFAKRK